jgi:hypothetical protein
LKIRLRYGLRPVLPPLAHLDCIEEMTTENGHGAARTRTQKAGRGQAVGERSCRSRPDVHGCEMRDRNVGDATEKCADSTETKIDGLLTMWSRHATILVVAVQLSRAT